MATSLDKKDTPSLENIDASSLSENHRQPCIYKKTVTRMQKQQQMFHDIKARKNSILTFDKIRGNHLIIQKSLDVLSKIHGAEVFLRKLCALKEDPRTPQKPTNKNNSFINAIPKILWDYVKLGEKFNKEFGHYYQLNPYVDLFLNEAYKQKFYEIRRISFRGESDTEGESTPYVSFMDKPTPKTLIEFAANLRTATTATGFKKKLTNYERATKENESEAKKHARGVFRGNDITTVFCFELFCQEPSPKSAHMSLMKDPVDNVKKCWKTFYTDLKIKYKKHLTGYIWKLEYDEIKGFHFYVFLFFDSQGLFSPASQRLEIAQLWDKVMVSGKHGAIFLGWRYFLPSHPYPKNQDCADLVRKDDRTTQDLFYKAMEYLFVTDNTCRANKKILKHCFGHGASIKKPAQKQGQKKNGTSQTKKADSKPRTPDGFMGNFGRG